MMAKVLQRVKSTELGVKEMKSEISNIRQLVDSYSTCVKQLEYQKSKMYKTLNKQKSGTLPNDTI